MQEELIRAITEMREDDANRITDEMLQGGDPLQVLEACRQAMIVIGQQFEAGDCFVPELILAGEMMRSISVKVKPHLLQAAAASEKLGKIVIGTVEGDIHDIGKDIVSFMLDVNGFEVIDIGVDVPPAKFVEAVKAHQPVAVALSGFLTLAYDPMKATVEALKTAGFTDTKVMIGGGQIDDQIRQFTGADAYGRDAMMAVSLAKQWIGAK